MLSLSIIQYNVLTPSFFVKQSTYGVNQRKALKTSLNETLRILPMLIVKRKFCFLTE